MNAWVQKRTVTVVNSTYRKYALFVRRRDEQKAQTYVKRISRQLSRRAVGTHLLSGQTGCDPNLRDGDTPEDIGRD